MTLAALLREDGHDVRAVYNGRFALRAAAEFEPEAVFLDINLPEINGWEVARQLRRAHVSPRPTIIALSGVYKKAADKILAELARIDYYPAKPYDPRRC